MKKVLKLLFFILWCFCTITVTSSFKIEKVKAGVNEAISKTVVELASSIFKLKPSGNKNFI